MKAIQYKQLKVRRNHNNENIDSIKNNDNKIV